MIEFTPTRTSTASIETLFDVMTDHRGLVDTTWMFRRTTLEREGTAAPNGVGAIRRLVAIGPPFIEIPPRRYGGTELFIGNLACDLYERGLDVTVYGNGESRLRYARPGRR